MPPKFKIPSLEKFGGMGVDTMFYQLYFASKTPNSSSEFPKKNFLFTLRLRECQNKLNLSQSNVKLTNFRDEESQ